MIQQQQEQTNQWVLTPVQFNLVKVIIVTIAYDDENKKSAQK